MKSRTDIKKIKPKRHVTVSGVYKPRNASKYVGDITKVIYRSSYERKFCIFCDTAQKIRKWSSEPFAIQYVSPIDKKIHEYFIDFWVKIEQDNGIIEEFLIEVKPKALLKKPEAPSKNTLKQIKIYNEKAKTYLINAAKFAAAKSFAAKRGCKFLIVTEDFLFNNK